MFIIDQIKVCHDEMITWWRHFDAFWETVFLEIRTANFLAIKLENFDTAVHRGMAKTEVAGTRT